MKYPVIYVKNLMGVHKHSSVSYALHLRIVSDEAEDEQRAAYQKKVLTQMYHMVENQFVVAQSKIVENDGDLFVLFTSNLDQRMLKQQLQILANELGARLGPGTQLEYALFRSLLKIEGKDLFLHAAKEGEPLGQSDIVARTRQELRPQGRGTTNFLTSLAQYQRKVEMQRSAEKGSDQA